MHLLVVNSPSREFDGFTAVASFGSKTQGFSFVPRSCFLVAKQPRSNERRRFSSLRKISQYTVHQLNDISRSRENHKVILIKICSVLLNIKIFLYVKYIFISIFIHTRIDSLS